MPRITMTINLWDEPDEYKMLANVESQTLTEEQCMQIAREMKDHFNQVVAENPDARAAADALAHPVRSINITQDFKGADPDRVFQRVMRTINSVP